jgi:isoleucyl-tRNA synthetase
VDEVNIKQVVVAQDLSGTRRLKASPEHRKLGPVFRKQAPAVAAALAELPEDLVRALHAGEPIALVVADGTVEITPEMVSFEELDREGFVTKTEGQVAVALDIRLTDALVREGLARDIIRHLQELRKEAGLELTDRITLRLAGDPLLLSVCEEHAETIQAETLALRLEAGGTDSAAEITVADRHLRVTLAKAGH